MSWYELLLALHILAAGLWFGSGVTLTVISYQLVDADPPAFGRFAAAAGNWAGRAHPGAALVILLAGFGMVADADLSLGELWITLALVGWVALMALGGGVVSPAGRRLNDAYERSGGTATEETRSAAERLLLVMRIEIVLVLLVIVDMVVKPG